MFLKLNIFKKPIFQLYVRCNSAEFSAQFLKFQNPNERSCVLNCCLAKKQIKHWDSVCVCTHAPASMRVCTQKGGVSSWEMM